MTTISAQILTCKKCKELVKNRTQPVIGVGPIPCNLVFIGEAPGANEDKKGEPFIGRAGAFLEAATFAAKLKKYKDYHILNVLKCRPPNNRAPNPNELKNCEPFLVQQLELIKPKVVVALGRYAQAFVLQTPASQISVMKNLGQIVKRDGYQAILSCHPSYVSRNPEAFVVLKIHVKRAAKLIKNLDKKRLTR